MSDHIGDCFNLARLAMEEARKLAERDVEMTSVLAAIGRIDFALASAAHLNRTVRDLRRVAREAAGF